MTLPTQTWRVSPKYNVSVAGAAITMTELIVGIKGMLDAEDTAATNYWTYCAQSTGADNYMLFKRKGSPGGVLGTFRAIIFGGSTVPHSTNIHFNVTATAANLYVASSEDHNSDTYANLYTTGAALSGKYNPGTKVVVTLSTLPTTSSIKVFMVECDEMCSIWITTSSNTNAACCFTFGRIVERAVDGVGLWGHFGTKDSPTGGETGVEAANANAAYPAIDSAANQVGGAIYDTSASKGLGRITYTPSIAGNADALQNDANSMAVVMPLLAGSKSAAGVTTCYCIGLLRQMRHSIRHTGQLALRDASNNVKGYLINAGFSANGRGLFYDQSP